MNKMSVIVLIVHYQMLAALRCYNCGVRSEVFRDSIECDDNKLEAIECNNSSDVLSVCMTYAKKDATLFKECRSFGLIDQKRYDIFIRDCDRLHNQEGHHCRYCMQDLCNRTLRMEGTLHMVWLLIVVWTLMCWKMRF